MNVSQNNNNSIGKFSTLRRALKSQGYSDYEIATQLRSQQQQNLQQQKAERLTRQTQAKTTNNEVNGISANNQYDSVLNKNNATTILDQTLSSSGISTNTDQWKEYEAQLRADSVNNDDSKEFLPSVGATLLDILASPVQGVVKGLEGIVDAGAGLAGAIGGIFGADTQWAQDFVAKDYTQELVGNTFDDLTEDSYLNDGWAGEIVNSVLEGAGQMLPSIAMNIVLPGSGMVVLGASAFGSAMEEAFNSNPDISYAGAVGYGALSAATEVATEKMFDVFKVFSKGGGVVDNLISKVTTSTTGKVAIGVLGEGVEEVVSDLVNPFWQRLTNVDENADMPTLGELAQTFAIGSLTSLVIQAPTTIRHGGVKGDLAVKSIENLTSVNNEMQMEIQNTIKDSMSKQEYQKLQTNAIEFKKRINEVIDEYNAGTLTNEKLDKLKVQRESLLAEMEKRINALPEEKRNKILEKTPFKQNGTFQDVADIARADVFDMTGIDNATGDSPLNVYNKLDEDIVTLETAQQNNETYEFKPISKQNIENLSNAKKRNINYANRVIKRINSKYGTNTKVIFTDNISVNGKTTANGAYSNGVIYINVNSDNPLRVIAVHEFTHSIEGTKIYEDLKDLVLNNEEATKEKDKLKKKYAKIGQTEDSTIESEMVANYVSEKVLGDYQSILSITKAKPNLAKKVLSWLKSKVSTLTKNNTDKKLLKNLENIKELYEKTIDASSKKTSPNNNNGVQYSVNDNTTKPKTKTKPTTTTTETINKQTKRKLEPLQYNGKNLIFDRDQVNNKEFFDLLPKEYISKLQQAQQRIALEGKNKKGRRRTAIELSKDIVYKGFTEVELQTIAELGERTQQPTTQAEQDLLARFLTAVGGIKTTTDYNNRSLSVIKPEYMPTYLKNAISKAKAAGLDVTFILDTPNSPSAFGWYNTNTKKIFVKINSGFDVTGTINHEIFHFLRGSNKHSKKTLDFMRKVQDILLKNGNDFGQAMQSMKNSYPGLPVTPFGKFSFTTNKYTENKTIDNISNTLLEEFCCEVCGGDFLTDIQELKDLRQKFMSDNSSMFITFEEETNVARNTLRKFTTNDIKIVNYDNPITPNKVKVKMEDATPTGKEKTHEAWLAGQIAFTNSMAGIEDAIYQMTNKKNKGEVSTNYSRGAQARAGFALDKGITINGKKLTKSFDDTFVKPFDKKYDKDLKPNEHYEYKQKFFDFLLHRHNVDRMNIQLSLKPSQVKTLQGITEETKKAINEVFKAKQVNGLTYQEIVDNVKTLNESEKTILEAELRYNKPIFGKYMYLDSLSETELKLIEKESPELFKLLQEETAVSESDVKRLATPALNDIVNNFTFEVSSDDSQLTIKRYLREFPEFKELAEEVDKWGVALMQLSVEQGLMTQKDADHYIKSYPHYVPTNREINYKRMSSKGVTVSRDGVGVNQVVRTANGSDIVIEPLDVMFARKVRQIYTAGATNQLANELYDTYNNSTLENKNDFITLKDEVVIRRSVDNIDYEDLANLPKQKEKGNIISFYKDGVLQTMEVNKFIYQGFEALSGNYQNYSESLMAKPIKILNSTFKKAVTSWNPAFLITNFAKDFADALIYTKNGTIKFIKNMPNAIKQMATNSELWQEYCSNGGLYSSIFDYNNGTQGAKQISKGKAKLKKSPFGKAARTVGNTLERANMSVEQITRFNEYILSRQSGKSIAEAMLDANEITVNFGRSGTVTKKLNNTIMPFLNAQVQGFSKFARTILSKKSLKGWANLLFKCFSLGLLAYLPALMFYDDDEDYQALSDYYKDNFLLIKIGNEFIKIPNGRIMSIFSSGIRRTMNALNGDTDAYDGYLDTITSSLSPVNEFRTLFSPINDVKTNTTWYGGTLESTKYNSMPESERYDEDTSWLAKQLGKTLNYSPIKINYLLDQYTGVIGDILIPMTSDSVKTNALTAVKNKFIVNPTEKNNYYSKFDKLYTEIQYYHYETEDAISQLQLRYLNKVKSKVADLYAKEDDIRKDTTLSDADKKAQLELNQILINNAYKYAIDNVKTIGDNLSRFELSETSIDDDYREALYMTFGAETALSLTHTTTYNKAKMLNENFTLDYDTFYKYYYDLKGSTYTSNQAFKVIKRDKNMNAKQKLILYASLGYSLNEKLKSRLKIYARQTKDAELKQYLLNLAK